MKKEKLKRIAKRITAFAAAVAMAATFTFPAEVGDGLFEGLGNAVVASAAYTKEYDISAGSVTIDQNGTFLIKGNGNPVGNTITVNSGITAEITLDNVNIVTSSQPAFTIANGSTGNVTIILNGTNILKTSKKIMPDFRRMVTQVQERLQLRDQVHSKHAVVTMEPALAAAMTEAVLILQLPTAW